MSAIESAVPNYVIVIPMRYASSRFPAKALHPLLGVPMILHTARRAMESAASEVVIATDDSRIRAVCEGAGLSVEMTARQHPSGTERIAEVAQIRKWPADQIIVGLQGDEPATNPTHLDQLAINLSTHEDADMATLCALLQHVDDYLNPNRVKVVTDHRGMALYFSRAPLPAQRQSLMAEAALTPDSMPSAYLHIGLYAYRRAYLETYRQMAPCTLESEEQLEQLRVLYYGGRIHVDRIEEPVVHGVDHPSDVARLERYMRQMHNG